MSMIKTPPGHWRFEGPIEWPKGHKAAFAWEHKLVPIRVLRSVSQTESMGRWLHISVSRPDRLPSWEELSKVKREFLGDSLQAYHVIPAKQDYVNVHAYCLHIWHPLDSKRCVANLQDLINEEAI